jgi:hypothetical protein
MADWDVVATRPAGGAAASGEWDVVEQQPVTAAPKKRRVGAGEAGMRGVGSTFAEQGNVLALAASAPAVLIDKLAGALTGRPVTAAQDFMFRNVADPTKRAVDAYAIDPNTEEMGTGAKVANVGGRIAAMLPSMVASGGAAAPVQASRGTVPLVRAAVEARQPVEAARIVAASSPAVRAGQGAVIAQPSFAVPSTINRAQQLMEGDVEGGDVVAASIANHLWNTGMGAAPLAVPGRIATRAASGAGINTGLGAAQRGTESAILGDEHAQLHQPAFGVEENAMDAGIGALMAALFGGRGAAPMPRAPRTIDGESSRVPDAQFMADFEAHKPILEANGITTPDDPRAPAAVAALNARSARRAEQRVSPADMPRGDQSEILDQINAGERHPAQTPWAGRVAEDRPPIVAGERPGTAFEATEGNLAGRAANEIGDADYALIARYTGLDEREIRALSTASRGKLLAKARQQSEADGGRAALRTSFEGGDEQASPASQPNVPGERAPFTHSQYEDTTARAQPSPADVAGMRPTPDAKRATAAKQKMLDELSKLREQYDRIVRMPEYREAKRMADAGMLREDQQKAFTKIEAQRQKLGRTIFDLESKIYDIEGRSELGSKSASGTSDRPFSARDTAEPTAEQSRMFEERARQKAAEEQQRAIDELEAEWRAREDLRQRQQRRAPKEEQAEARYRNSERSGEASKEGEAGRFRVDEDGFVMSDKGAPVWFGHQRDAGWWILKRGNKESPDQLFEIANHPSGQGYTVRQRGVNATEPPPGGDAPVTPGRGIVPRDPNAPRAPEPPQQPRGGSSGEPAAQQQPAQQSEPPRPQQQEIRVGMADPEVRGELERMGGEAGWDEVGGRLLRDQDGNVTGRTRWIPRAEWWQGRPDPKRMNEKAVRETVRKALAGEPLSRGEQRMIDYLTEVAQRRVDEDRALQETSVREQRQVDDEAAAEREAIRWESSEQARADDDFDVGFGRELSDEEAAAFWNEGGDVGNQNREVQGARVSPEGAEAQAAGGRANVAGADEPIQPAGREAQHANPAEERADLQPGRDGGNDRPGDDGFELRGERPDELQRREQQRRDDERRVAEEQQRAEAPPADDFTLSGSDRPADELAARGQTGLFEQPGPRSERGFINLTPIAEAVSKALDWSAEHTHGWLKSVSNVGDALRSTKDAVRDSVVVRFAHAMFESAAGVVRSRIGKHNSSTAEWVIDQFHTAAGSSRVTGETFQSAVQAWTNGQVTRLSAALDSIGDDAAALKQIANLVRNPSGIRRGTKVGDAAASIRAILDDALKYMREAGVDVGEVKHGYYPREFDVDAVVRDGEAFRKAVAQAYREAGMPRQDADAAALDLHDRLLYGEVSSMFGSSTGGARAPFIKGRVFGKQVDMESHPLHKFLLHDPSLSIPLYLQRAAKRAEIARRFGDNFSHWGEGWKDARGKHHKSLSEQIHAEGAGAAIRDIKDFVLLAAGLKHPGVGDTLTRSTSFVRTWGALMFLEKATLSSLTEFITPAIRSGNVLDVSRSLSRTVTALVGTASAKQRRALAEDLHIIAGGVSDTINAARFAGGDPVSLKQSRALDKFFRRTGLTQWTDATRVAAMDVGRVFIRRLAKEVDEGGGKLVERHLAELGVPKEQAKSFAKFVLSKNDGMPMVGDLAGAHGEVYRAAVRRFVMQSIMLPDATTKPSWMSHPLGAVLGQLQSFNYAFYENVIKRNARLAKEAATGADYTKMERARMLAPLAIMPLLVVTAYVIGEARDAVLGDPNRRKEETTGQKWTKAASRGLPIAPLDPWINYVTSARYQRGAADFFAGPAIGTGGRGLDAARNALFNNSDETNTAERQAAKAAYDIVIEPAVNMALTRTPVGIGSAAVTQIAGSGGVREKFVSAVAGPDKKRQGGSTY